MFCVVSENNEIWKRITVAKSGKDLFVSNKGKAMKEDGTVLKLCDNGAGYLSVLAGQGSSKREYIHRLVASTFLENPEGLSQVNHIDCNKSNNSIENLEWVSGSANIRDAHKKGRMKKRTDNGQINVLTKAQVVFLYTSVLQGRGISEMARDMGIPRTTASSIMNKRSRSDITDKIDLEYATV